MARIYTNRKSGFIQRSGAMRRETQWFNLLEFNLTLAAGAATLISQLSATGLALRPFTVVRVRGVVGIRSDQEAASEDLTGAYGMCVVSDQAEAIGVTAIPTPITDSVSDLWFVYQYLIGRLQVTPAGTGPWWSDMTIVDSKAMRKVEEGQQLVEVVENGVQSTDGIVIAGGVRQLIKLH